VKSYGRDSLEASKSPETKLVGTRLRNQVLKPLIDAGLVEMTIPDNQRSEQESRIA